MKQYDFILSGGGAAGLSLAYYLSCSSLKAKKILIIDKDRKNKNDRTWGFWSRQKTAFDHLAKLRFEELDFVSSYYHKRISLGAYSYQLIRGIDFYNFIKDHLSQFPNIEFINTSIRQLSNSDDLGLVETDQGTFSAPWVFNSIFNEDEIRRAAASKLYLRQHFKGWLIETPEARFDPSSFSMFDFRTLQQGLMRFFYLIPFSQNRALVEYTLFSEDLLEDSQYDFAIKTYIREVLEIDKYKILEKETGIIPMTDYAFPASQGEHIINIGSLGGSSKPSSGYTFMRIQKHVQKIVAALEAGKSPHIPAQSKARYRFYDSILLNILKTRGDQAERLFSLMFKNNSIHQLFQFLDEQGGILNDLKIISSLPPMPFLRSTANLVMKK